MKPLRRKHQSEVTEDLLTGDERRLAMVNEIDVIADDGSVDTHQKRQVYFCDCGCVGAAGGRCAECGALSCGRCHGHCAHCAKPICLEHSKFEDNSRSPGVRMCRRCHDGETRKRRVVAAIKTLLSPIVEFEK